MSIVMTGGGTGEHLTSIVSFLLLSSKETSSPEVEHMLCIFSCCFLLNLTRCYARGNELSLSPDTLPDIDNREIIFKGIEQSYYYEGYVVEK